MYPPANSSLIARVRRPGHALLTLWIAACAGAGSPPADNGQPLAEGETMTIEGTIRRIDVEGGCWVIEPSRGRRYEPIELPAEFRSDGLRVRATLRDAPEMASICQVGPLVRIERIEKR